MPSIFAIQSLLAATLWICLIQTAAAELPWPTKTGPTANGNVDPASSSVIPVEWDEASDNNIQWKVPVQLTGHSTPVVGAGRIWLTSATADGTEQYVDCYDAESGQRLHHKLLFENPAPEPLGNPINNYAAPSPVLEADGVYVHFGTYGTARLNPSTAEVVWQRRDINVRHFRGPGSSPIVFEELLILTFDGIDDQFVIALDKKTGETIWKTQRTTDYGDLGSDGKPQRDGDLRKAYGTPALATVDGRTQVISVGSRAAFGYDARSGQELWTVTHDSYNAAAQPLIFEDLAIINTGSRAHLLAVRLDATTRGDVTHSHVVWDRPTGNSHLSFPVLVNDQVVFITDRGVATAVAARTGEESWSARVRGDYVASPLVAGRRVYFCNKAGVTSVGEADAEGWHELAQNELAEGMTASPAAGVAALILRTEGHLYKIGQPAKNQVDPAPIDP